MFRVLLSSTGKAYVKNCFDETEDEFMNELKEFVYSGDTILVTEDLDNLEETLGRNYEIVLLNEDNEN